ncbi:MULTISPECIES: DUF3618 domain-containing protein [Streptomyces]|uniref:DUF3618 domain-containing protein n=1 Tax=Streptomyces TaxID=1883 RepID=UPI001928E332|nr:MULTISPECIES: DUF3618 domain-containing protein [Streptomyces]
MRRQIAETRSQLGDTVEELAAKADVKGRARARAADLRDRAGALTVQLRSTAAHAGHIAQDRAVRAGHTVQGTAGRAGGAVRDTVPGPVKTAATAVVQAGLRHRRPVLIAGAGAGALVAAGLLRRRQGGRH